MTTYCVYVGNLAHNRFADQFLPDIARWLDMNVRPEDVFSHANLIAWLDRDIENGTLSENIFKQRELMGRIGRKLAGTGILSDCIDENDVEKWCKTNGYTLVEK